MPLPAGQGISRVLPRSCHAEPCPSARKAENDHKSPGGYSDDITGHLSRLSFNSELVGLPRSAGCLVARCIAAQRAGGVATFSWVPCVLCPLWGLVPALGSCARSGVLCPLWGLVPTLGSCAPQGLLFRISRETEMRCHLLGTLAAGRSGRGRSGLGALWPPGALASGRSGLWVL